MFVHACRRLRCNSLTIVYDRRGIPLHGRAVMRGSWCLHARGKALMLSVMARPVARIACATMTELPHGGRALPAKEAEEGYKV